MRIHHLLCGLALALVTLLSNSTLAKDLGQPVHHVYAVFASPDAAAAFASSVPADIFCTEFAPLMQRAMPSSVQSTPSVDVRERLMRTVSVCATRVLPLSTWKEQFDVRFEYPSKPWFLGPNDPRVNDQSYVHTVNATEAWEIQAGNSDVVIGISDAGTDQNHEDLIDNIALNEFEIFDNGVDDDNNGFVDDFAGVNLVWEIDGSNPSSTYGQNHGTQVAGIAGATYNNGIGIAGVGGKCKIFPMKIFAEDEGVFLGWESLLYAAAMHIDIVNCSWGTDVEINVERDIVAFCIESGVTIVAAAGNAGNSSEYSAPLYPAAYPGVTGVAVTWPDDVLVSESSVGAHCDVAAPGHDALTTSNDDGYGNFYLTSSAAPIVSGIAGLVKSKWPFLNSYQVQSILRKSGADIRAVNPSNADMVPVAVRADAALADKNVLSPGLALESFAILDEDGKQVIRTEVGATYQLQMVVRNHIAKGTNLQAIVSLGDNKKDALRVLDSVSNEFDVDGAGTATVHGIAFEVVEHDSERRFFNVEFVSQDKSYRERIQIPITPTPGYATYRTPVSSLTMADNGRIGFADSRVDRRNKGVGMRYGQDNVLYEGGLIAGLLDQELYTCSRGVDFPELRNDFTIVHPFGKFSDYDGRVEIRTTEGADSVVFTVDRSVTPDSATGLFVIEHAMSLQNHLSGPAIGYYLDLDIGEETDENSGVVVFDGIHSTLNEQLVVSAYDAPDEEYVVVAAVAVLKYSHQGHQLQTCIVSNDAGDAETPFGTTDGVSNGERRLAFSSGTKYSEIENVDVGTFVGASWPEATSPQRWYFNSFIVLGVMERGQNYTEKVVDALQNVTVNSTHLAITNQPESELVAVPIRDGSVHLKNIDDASEVLVYDIQGRALSCRWNAGAQGVSIVISSYEAVTPLFITVVNASGSRSFVAFK